MNKRSYRMTYQDSGSRDICFCAARDCKTRCRRNRQLPFFKVMEKKFTGLSNAAGKSGVCAVLTPDRINKRQNGRRIKEDGEPAFTITAEDRHGVMLNDGNMCYIRKLTPKECWR